MNEIFYKMSFLEIFFQNVNTNFKMIVLCVPQLEKNGVREIV